MATFTSGMDRRDLFEMDRRTLLKTLGSGRSGRGVLEVQRGGGTSAERECLQRALSHRILAVYAGRQTGSRVPEQPGEVLQSRRIPGLIWPENASEWSTLRPANALPGPRP